MKTFTATDGREWVATAAEEEVSRHHGRWYMVLRPADDPETTLVLPEVRWQTARTADRSIRTMSRFELERRLRMASNRVEAPDPMRDTFGAWTGTGPGPKEGPSAG
jgi:hypothetical protein